MFIDIFGKKYKRNPNLIDANFFQTELNWLIDILQEQGDCSAVWKTTIIEPLIKSLKEAKQLNNSFLVVELRLMQQLTLRESNKVSGNCRLLLFNKISELLSDENIERNRAIAEF